MSGPLTGVRVVEIAGIGPGPFCAMMLADMGAEVLRVDRASAVVPPDRFEPPPDHALLRGRRSVAVDLKHPEGAAIVLRLVETADALIEGFRPGVAERLGIGPEPCLARNPRLVYGRMTGWGQEGPYASQPGHDINYIALTGVLHAIGRAGDGPTPPLNVVGDFGGGGMLLAFGIVCALLEARTSGAGQVVDAAMVDGAALLGTMLHGMRRAGTWSNERGTNLLDGGAPFYDVYETADGGWISIGSIEPQFYAALLEALGLRKADLPAQHDRARWPEMKARFAEIFRSRTRAEWEARLAQAGICFAPVLDPDEALEHPHMVARSTFVDVGGVRQPAPAPRFSRTPGAVASPPPMPGEHTDDALRDWGLAEGEIARLREAGAIA
jgi:alpha-methylacyl-CoA racemase